MMRRMICFALVLMMSLALACPVLATNSPNGDAPYTPPTDIPKTGDQIMMYVIVMVVALLALVAVVVLSRKMFKK